MLTDVLFQALSPFLYSERSYWPVSVFYFGDSDVLREGYISATPDLTVAGAARPLCS